MTEFTETRALLFALEDAEADSGNHELLDEYLRENFTQREVRSLAVAAEVLADRAWAMVQEKRRPA